MSLFNFSRLADQMMRGLADGEDDQPVAGVSPTPNDSTPEPDFGIDYSALPETPEAAYYAGSGNTNQQAEFFTEPNNVGQTVTVLPEPNDISAAPRFARYDRQAQTTALIDAQDAPDMLGGRFSANVPNNFRLGSRVLKVQGGDLWGRMTYFEIIDPPSQAPSQIVLVNEQYVDGLQAPETTDESLQPTTTDMCNTDTGVFGKVADFFTQKRVVCYDNDKKPAYTDDKTFEGAECDEAGKRKDEVQLGQASQLKLNACEVVTEPNLMRIGLGVAGLAAATVGIVAIVK